MYFQDLTLLHYHKGPFDATSWHAPLLAIGWLEHPYPYLKGAQQPELGTELQRMVDQAKVSQANVHFRGLHHCSLCRANHHEEATLQDSYVNLFVPGTSVVYVAPAGISHYVQSHLYQPPSDFVVAINNCPEYGTPAFFQALRAANHHQKIPLLDKEEQEEETRAFRARLQKIVEARRRIP